MATRLSGIYSEPSHQPDRSYPVSTGQCARYQDSACSIRLCMGTGYAATTTIRPAYGILLDTAAAHACSSYSDSTMRSHILALC